METKKFNSEKNARAGRDNTKNILTAAGLSAVAGAASGAAIALKFKVKTKEDQEKETLQEPNAVNETATNEQQTGQTQQQTEQTQQQTQATTANDNANGPQPTDSTGGTGESTQQQPQQQQQTAADDDVDPDLIAQQIAGASEVDDADIDAPNVVTVERMDVAYGPDGTEHMVAIVRTPDGSEFMLADTDGDGVFSEVYDLNGNFVGNTENSLTASDLQEAADPTGGYMAYNGDEPMGEDPTRDIVATDTTPQQDTTDTASNNEELPDLDNLLAQLLSDNEESMDDAGERELVVGPSSDDDDEDEDDDDNQDDYDDDDNEDDDDSYDE